MQNQEHLDILKQGVDVWNAWRAQHKEVRPDLSRADLIQANLRYADLIQANLYGANLIQANLRYADLSRADLIQANLTGANLNDADLSGVNLGGANLYGAILSEANLSDANLTGADLRDSDLSDADLSGANLSGADLSDADLSGVNLSGANLIQANLSDADLSDADLSGVNLSGVNLSKTILVGTNLANTTLKDCSIYGISAWDVQLDGAVQLNLTITPEDQPIITVDNLKVAQFLYLLLNNREIRDVINTLTTKSVLILGRFTPERKVVLDALREALRQHNYLPILFDFEKPASRDITETISTLAHLARFVIADLTDAKSIPQELMLVVPNLPSVPVQPLILNSEHEYGMFEHFTRYPWVLPVYRYTDEISLLQSLHEKVIAPAEQKAKELAP